MSGCSSHNIQKASKDGDLEKLKSSLNDDNASEHIEKPSENGTPLCIAAQEGHTEVMKLLIQSGADLEGGNRTGDKSRNALFSAVGFNQPAAVQVMLDTEIDTKIKNIKGETAYQKAVKQGNSEIISLFKNFKKKVDKGHHDNDYIYANEQNSYDAYANFLSNYPDTEKRQSLLKKMAKLISTKAEARKYADVYIQKYPTGHKYLKPGAWLKNIGPESMKVRDILTNLKSGVSTKILSAKIKNVNTGYKDFSLPEVRYLTKLGLNDSVIESMIIVTGKVKANQKRALENKEHLAKIQSLIDKSSQSAGTTASSSATGSGTADCLKLKAAIMACSRAPFLLAAACKITARSQFECSIDF